MRPLLKGRRTFWDVRWNEVSRSSHDVKDRPVETSSGRGLDEASRLQDLEPLGMFQVETSNFQLPT